MALEPKTKLYEALFRFDGDACVGAHIQNIEGIWDTVANAWYPGTANPGQAIPVSLTDEATKVALTAVLGDTCMALTVRAETAEAQLAASQARVAELEAQLA